MRQSGLASPVAVQAMARDRFRRPLVLSLVPLLVALMVGISYFAIDETGLHGSAGAFNVLIPKGRPSERALHDYLIGAHAVMTVSKPDGGPIVTRTTADGRGWVKVALPPGPYEISRPGALKPLAVNVGVWGYTEFPQSEGEIVPLP